MGEQESEETLKALKIEQKMLEERLKNIAIKMRLIILKESAKDVTSYRTTNGRRQL